MIIGDDNFRHFCGSFYHSNIKTSSYLSNRLFLETFESAIHVNSYFVLWIIAFWDSRCRQIIDVFQVLFPGLGLWWHRVLRTINHLFPMQINFMKITEQISIFGHFFCWKIGILSILRQPVSPNCWFFSGFLSRSWFVLT